MVVSMRPRDEINRRKKTYFVIVGVSFLAMAALAYTETYLPESVHSFLSIGVITVFVVGVILMYVGIPCPKCNSRLGLKYVYAEETLKRCPKCGIAFDEDSL